VLPPYSSCAWERIRKERIRGNKIGKVWEREEYG